MAKYTHASIVPLIGGMTLAQHDHSGSLPEYLLTYEGFQENESHLLNHYREKYGADIPYYFIDRGEKPAKRVDVVNTTCPCAGLSQLSHGFGTDNKNNQWMIKSAKYVLGELKPRVFWGENAPGFAGKIGDDIRNQLIEIGQQNGYSMSIYRTKSLLHGNPQVRSRSFYFFWEKNRVPRFNWYSTPYQKIEDLIRGVRSNFQMETINQKTPSADDPYYKFILSEMCGGIDHKTFSRERMVAMSPRTNDVLSFIESQGVKYSALTDWLRANGHEREAVKCERRGAKLANGQNIMRRGTIIPYDHIGAFVGHYPTSLTHPDEDRYITYREAMSIMGLPEDFELLNPKKNSNHICQNVPFKTARDMAHEVFESLEDRRDWIDASYYIQYNYNQTEEIVRAGNRSTKTLEEFF